MNLKKRCVKAYSFSGTLVGKEVDSGMAVMSVVIRMARQGTKMKPVFAIVAMNKSDKRDGRCLERLGQYFPKAKTDKEKLTVDRQKVDAWVKKGARLSQTVGQLLRTQSK